MQQKANDLDNQRGDNVALTLNRRYIVRRSAMIDYGGLQRNAPGGITETDDPNNDIKIENPPDITSSSYQEHDRINADFDELAGTFSSGSVNTNRNLNETVGGMELLSGSADIMTEYPLKTFVVTWVVPVLKQLIRLEQHHETDGALLNLIGEKLQLWQKFGINRVTDAWIQGSMNIKVNVGFGATNPQQRIDRLGRALNTIAAFSPQQILKLDGDELTKEVLGAVGYSGADRFFPENANPQQMPGANEQEGKLTEADQAKLDQDFQIHQETMEDKHLDRIARMQEKQMEMELQQMKLYEQKLISEDTYNQNMAKIQTERQNTVDKLMVALQEHQLRRETGEGV
jgi:hypothetical protein